MMSEPLGEVGANFSLQLSSRTQFTKINNKKVIAENQCEKHRKSSLHTYKDSNSIYILLGYHKSLSGQSDAATDQHEHIMSSSKTTVISIKSYLLCASMFVRTCEYHAMIQRKEL